MFSEISLRFCVDTGQLSFIDSETKDHKPPTLKSPMRKSSSVKKTFSMNLMGDHTKQNQDSEEKHERQRKPVSEPPRIQPPLRTRSEPRAPPPPPPPLLSPSPLRLPPRETKRQSSEHTSRKDDSTADAWEKAELSKIKARYEKLNRKIDLWEAKKREKARRKLDISEVDNIMTLYNLIS
jgi:hypothetical protein